MKHEYKTRIIDTQGLLGGKLDATELDDTLNRMARDGWELVQMAPTAQETGRTRALVCVFKRVEA